MQVNYNIFQVQFLNLGMQVDHIIEYLSHWGQHPGEIHGAVSWIIPYKVVGQNEAFLSLKEAGVWVVHLVHLGNHRIYQAKVLSQSGYVPRIMIFYQLSCVVDKFMPECLNEHLIQFMHTELIFIQVFMQGLAVPRMKHIVRVMRYLNDWSHLAFVLIRFYFVKSCFKHCIFQRSES